MSFLDKFFARRRAEGAPKAPWELTIESMIDKDLDCFEGVVEALYSKDNTRRYVILQGADGLYRYEYQELRPYSKEEREFFAQMGRDAEAYWTIDCTRDDQPGWPTREDVQRQMEKETVYKKHF